MRRLDIRDYHTEDRSCPDCKAILSGAMHLEGGEPPQDGDVSFCTYCACLSIFDGPTLRRPTDAELASILSDPKVREHQVLIQMMIARRATQSPSTNNNQEQPNHE